MSNRGTEEETMTTEQKPQGHTRRELLAIVAASNRRFDRIGEVWTELTDEEQEALAAQAEKYVEESR